SFGSFTSNTIGLISVQLDPAQRPLRQRINLRGSRVLGIELVGTAHLRDDLALDGQIAVMHMEALQTNPTDSDKLAEKPNALGRLALSYGTGAGPNARFESVYTGVAYSPDDQNSFLRLDPSLVINARFGYTFHLTDTHTLEMFIRGDNLTDAVVLPQLGLPAQGRTISGGMDFTL
ncbi:MAG: TonB-dependent receptor, partial [Gemmatimonadota bacterium]|nr:TonB-dependent receptor [Gemmatimonadota bacterium]